MITIERYNPSPRCVWLTLYAVARYTRTEHQTTRENIVRTEAQFFEKHFNIDSDYLMETMGKYAISIS